MHGHGRNRDSWHCQSLPVWFWPPGSVSLRAGARAPTRRLGVRPGPALAARCRPGGLRPAGRQGAQRLGPRARYPCGQADDSDAHASDHTGTPALSYSRGAVNAGATGHVRYCKQIFANIDHQRIFFGTRYLVRRYLTLTLACSFA